MSKKISILLLQLVIVANAFAQNYNMSNPQDLAKLHNDLLGYIAAQNGANSNFGTIEAFPASLSAVTEFYTTNQISVSSYPSKSDVIAMIEDFKQGQFAEMMISKGMSENVAQQVENLVNSSKNATTFAQLESIVSPYLLFEDGDENDIFVLRAMCHTLLKSADFWYTAANDPSSPYHKSAISRPGVPTILAKPNWWKVGADCVGLGLGLLLGGGTPAGVAAGVAIGTMLSDAI